MPAQSDSHNLAVLLEQHPEQALQLLLDAVQDFAIFMLDPAGRVVTWSAGAQQITGYRSSEIVQQHFSIMYTPEDRAAGVPEQELSDALTTGPREAEGWRVRKDGSRFRAEAFTTALYERDGRHMGFARITRDVTRRRAIEDSLRASEERFRLLIAGVTDVAIFMLDPTGQVATWNDGAARITLYSEDEITGRHFSRFYTRDDVADGLPEDGLREAQLLGRIEEEGWRLRKDGSRFWANVILTALRDECGSLRGYSVITRDMTARRLAEGLLRSVVDTTIDGIVIIDDRGIIQSFNQAAERTFGYSQGEVLGMNVSMLMPDPYQREHDGYLANYLRTGNAKIIGIGREVEGLRKDGTRFPVDLGVSGFQLDDRQYFTGVVRDISEKKRLETQLNQAQKMEAIGQLAGGIAHDFNNILTVIEGYGEMLMTMCSPHDPRLTCVNEIRSAGQKAAVLTRQLLAFGRRQVLEPRVVDLNEIVVNFEKMLRRIIGEDVDLTVRLAPDMRPVRVDPGQLEQVVMNLVINARDAMPSGGQLTIETSLVEFNDASPARPPEWRAGTYVMLAVRDTGCGIPPEVRARLFEPFFTTKPAGKGSGLGLATVYGIVRQSDGQIEVESEVGAGSCFRMYLPAVLNAVDVSHPEVDAFGAIAGGETILLAEDEPGVRMIAKLSLESHGYNVIDAASGMEAAELAEQYAGRIDLLVTDVIMPQMSGRQLADTLTAKFPGLKVLFLSGYTDDAVMRHGILAAEVSFLQKPFSPVALTRKVREVLDAHQPHA
jgi:PAS domain S-box-containing protein